MKGVDAFPFNENIIFVIQRCIIGVAIIMAGILGSAGEWYVPALALGASLPMFFFFHDGAYYKARNMINDIIYPKGWWDKSITSSAETKTVGPLLRFILFIVGVSITFILQVKLY
jgi:hypothetical protein